MPDVYVSEIDFGDGIKRKIKGSGGSGDMEKSVYDPNDEVATAGGITDYVDSVLPTKTSDLTNDSNFVVDSTYVHTDNNYTTTEKNKLSGIPTLGTAATKDVPSSGNAGSTQVVMGNDTRLSDKRKASDVYDWAKAATKPDYTASEVGAIATTAKGASNGVAELDANGKVPSSQLPSYVDDVLEYASFNNFPLSGESGKIYIAQDTNKTYRWSGSAYVEISASLALGETSSTAYRGDRGKTAYDHASAKGSAFTSGMYKITTNSEGHVTAATAVAKSDITALGIPGSDTWRGIQDNLTSSANTTESLSAKQGYLLANGSAKDNTKLPLAGGSMTGAIILPENNVQFKFRNNATWGVTSSYQTSGKEALVFASKNELTSFMFVNGEDSETHHENNRWMSLTPGLQIKQNSVSIGALIGSEETPAYKLNVAGTLNATGAITQNGSAVALKPTIKSQSLAANATSVTFTGIPTSGNNLIDFFITDGANYTAINTATSGQITLTYAASSSARTVYCRIEGV